MQRPVRPKLAAAIASLALLASGCGGGSDRPPPGAVPNPLRFQAGARADYEQRASAGLAHVLYARSPGGVLATAARTARYRSLAEAVARTAHVDPDTLEALVFLESAGRPDVVAANDPVNAAGLTQIVASTGTGLLGMRIDLPASRRLTAAIARADAQGRHARAGTLRAQRRAVDPRFDPAQALAATGRYLKTARRTFHREDLTFVSYHMGIGNLATAIRDFGGDPGSDSLSYAELYFDSTPLRHAAAYRRLIGFGDDSISYYWRLRAARSIMQLYRRDRGRLARQAKLQAGAASSELVLHPPRETPSYGDPAAVRDALDARELVPLPSASARKGPLVVGPEVGALARNLDRPGSLYRALRPAGVDALSYLAAGVRAIVPAGPPLTVTGAVRDRRYDNRLEGGPDGGGSQPARMHATGFAFDVARRYGTHAQAEAVQFMLDRLTAMNLIAWVRLPGNLHITASRDAVALAPWLKSDGRIKQA